ncbi:signal peptidase I [Actinokineospora terrae]|uniref:Signal peptidase I n=1 Tax=Actinokineospora terrae TaxID=155974 RepID=A0A1H9W164_9PSEU|nr:signal peptidase I [Actinokineospora terrae]SES27253.1 hypothetical protein SAMN04487818_109235 [Actinokineospora terrae]
MHPTPNDPTQRWTSGNAADDTTNTRGWLVGHFIDPSEGVRSSKDVEVKWGTHPAGDKRPEWTSDDQRTTLVVLVSGHFRVDLTGGHHAMTRPGDYVMWGAGVDHSWEALADSIVMTVRWPSAA